MNDQQNIIIYRTADGRASVASLCQGWEDMAQSATDGRTFCHLEAKY